RHPWRVAAQDLTGDAAPLRHRAVRSGSARAASVGSARRAARMPSVRPGSINSQGRGRTAQPHGAPIIVLREPGCSTVGRTTVRRASTARRQERRGRYTPESMAHPGKMLPSIARYLIATYTLPGEWVLD